MFSIPTLLGDAQQRRSLHDSDVKGGYLESFPNSLPTTNDDSGKIPMLLYPDAHAYLQAKLLFEQTLKSSNKNVINDAEPSLENFLLSLKQVQQLANFSHLAKHLKESLTLNSNSFKLSCPAQADKIDPESGDSGREYGDEDIEIDDNSDCERDDFKASSDRAITASGSGCFDPNNSNSKRRRTSFNSVQLLQLEREFLSKKYLSLNERAELARTLKLSQEQIKVWFQNRRAKWKRSKGYRSTQARGGDADASANNSSDGDAHHSSMVTPTSGGGGGGHNSSHKIHVPIPVHVDRVRLRSQQQQIEKQQQRYISASHQQTANTSHIESAVPQHSSLQQAFDLLESRYPGGSLLAQPSSTMISTYLARYELLPSPNSAFQIVRR